MNRTLLWTLGALSFTLLLAGCSSQPASTNNAIPYGDTAQRATNNTQSGSPSTSRNSTPSNQPVSSSTPANTAEASNTATDNTDTAVVPTAPTLSDVNQLKAAWNKVASQVDPLAEMRNLHPEADGRFYAQIGTHVLLTGQVTPSGYFIDVFPDHAISNAREAEDLLLEDWQILIQTTGGQAKSSNAILSTLGLLNPNLKVSSKEQYNVNSTGAKGVTFELGFAQAPILSAVSTPSTLTRTGYGVEEKFAMVLRSGSPVQRISAQDVQDMEYRDKMPMGLTSQSLKQSGKDLFAQLQAITKWTVDAMPTPNFHDLSTPYPTHAVPVVTAAAMQRIEKDDKTFYTLGFTASLATNVTWAGMGEGTVVDGSLAVKGLQYGQGRMFILPEPPFQEGEQAFVQNPLYSDATNYKWTDLRMFATADASKLNKVVVKGNTITVVLNITYNTSETAQSQTMTYTFHVTPETSGSDKLLISGIEVPAFGGE